MITRKFSRIIEFDIPPIVSVTFGDPFQGMIQLKIRKYNPCNGNKIYSHTSTLSTYLLQEEPKEP